MKLTMRATAKKVTLITTAFVLAVSSLTAAVPFVLSQKASALTTVTSQAELISAIAGGDSVIDLGASFQTTSQININRSLTLNGHGFSLSPTFSGSPSNDTVLAVVGGNVAINNVVIEGLGGTALQGIQVWQSSATLNSVTSRNNDKAGIHVNGSNVTVNNVTTEKNGNNYGGVLVSGGTLTINGQSHHNGENISQVRRDGGAVVDTNAQYNNFLNFIYNLKPAPAAPVITAPTANQAVSAPNGNVVVSWNAASYATTYELKVDSVVQTGITTTSVTKQLTEGAHTIQLRSVAKSGLAGTWGGARTFTVTIPDTTPPTFAITNLSEGQLVGTASTHKLSIQGTFTDPSGGYVQLQLVKPGIGSVGLITTHAPVNAGQLAEFDVTGFTDGPYQLTASATDYLGNALPVQSINFVIDNTAPKVTFQSDANIKVATGKPVANVAGTTPIRLRVDGEANNSVIDKYIYVDGNLIDHYNSVHRNRDFQLNTVALGLSEGVHVLTGKAIDEAGNETTSTPVTFVVDNAKPTAEFIFPTAGPSATSFQVKFSEAVNEADAKNAANYFLENWPGASSSDGDLVGDANVTYDAASKTATVTFTNSGWYVSPEQKWVVKNVRDLAGNAVVDTSAYSTPLVKPVFLSIPAGTSSANSSTQTFTWSAVDPSDATNASGIKGYEYALVNAGATPTSWTFTTASSVTFTGLADGTYQLYVRILDNAGNVSSEEYSQALVDVTPPAAAITSFTAGRVAGTADPDATLVVTVDGVDSTPFTPETDGTWEYLITPGLTVGTHTASVKAKDGAGNEFTPTVKTLAIAAPIVSVSSTSDGGDGGDNSGSDDSSTQQFPSAAGLRSVLGTENSTTTGDDTTAGTEGVEGTSTEKNLAAAVDTDSSDGTVLGMAWYWWLLILAALATLIWWIIAALRNRAAQN